MFENSGWELLEWKPDWDLPEPYPSRPAPDIPSWFPRSFTKRSTHKHMLMLIKYCHMLDYRPFVSGRDSQLIRIHSRELQLYRDEFLKWLLEERTNYFNSLTSAQKTKFQHSQTYNIVEIGDLIGFGYWNPELETVVEIRNQMMLEPIDARNYAYELRTRVSEISQQAFREGRNFSDVAKERTTRERNEAIERDKYSL